MSIEALNWVLNQAPDVASHELPVLTGYANHAHPDGTSSYPSVPTLSRYSRKGERAVQKDIKSLLEKGLMRFGDQRHVQHIPIDRRPTVYDLAMERRMDNGIVAPPVRLVSGKAAQPVLAATPVPTQRQPEPAAASGKQAAMEAAAAAKRARIAAARKCSRHQGELANNCGPCKGELLGVTA